PVDFYYSAAATAELYTLSLHDALPIYAPGAARGEPVPRAGVPERGADAAADPGGHRRARGIGGAGQGQGLRPGDGAGRPGDPGEDRKSTRLNSSHVKISYAVFCLKKKK